MMKSLSKSVVVSLIMILICLFILANSVFALGNLGISPTGNDGGNTTGNDLGVGGNTSTITPTGNTVGNTTGNTVQTNIVKINEINSDKDLPQTGENDIYLISVIGLAAVVIGSVAYVKSKKYDI